MVFSNTSRCKLQILHHGICRPFQYFQKLKETSFLRLVLGDVNLKGGKCQCFHICRMCFDIQYQVFKNTELNFSHRGINQQLFSCTASFKNNFLGNVSHNELFEDLKNNQMQTIDFSCEPNLYFSKRTDCISSIRLSIATFINIKTYLTVKQSLFFFATGT